MKLTLGFSPCPNDTFIFDAMIHHRIDTGGLEFDVRLEDVETLNRMALAGELDITKLSYHAYGHVMDKYVLLNAGSALGEKCGPLLIARSEVSGEEIMAGPVAVPGELTTANFLFSLEYPNAVNKSFMQFDRIEEAVLSGDAVAGVIIHENRFTYADRGLVKICDLGDRWEESTGFPIPLGGIAIRRDIDPKIAENVNLSLKKSVQYGFLNPRKSKGYIKKHSQELEDDVIDQHIALYVNHYTEDLGAGGKEAVEFMLNKASSLGVIGKLVQPLILPV